MFNKLNKKRKSIIAKCLTIIPNRNNDNTYNNNYNHKNKLFLPLVNKGHHKVFYSTFDMVFHRPKTTFIIEGKINNARRQVLLYPFFLLLLFMLPRIYDE